MEKYIESKKQKTIEVYKTQSERIVSDYRREKEYMQGYHGRELLELIQNADDELTEDQSREISISYYKDTLTISNCGTPFSKKGVDSLMLSNISDKKSRKKKVIGNKGTGFRAILGWAEKITIHSGDLHIAFSDDYSQKYLKSAIDFELEDDGAAILAFPEWIQEQYIGNFTTEISIKVKNDENISNDIITQLEAIDGTLLLFLNMAEAICINTDTYSVRFVRTIHDDKVVVKKYEQGKEPEEIVWLLNRREEYIGDKSYTVVVAYRTDGKAPEKQVIYNYFPTEVEFPYPVLLHANLNLDANRNHLIKGDEANKRILNTAATLLIDTALKLTKSEKEASYDALSIVVENKTMHKDLRDYHFREILLEQIKTSKILPTVENEYIAFSDNPFFYKSKLATILNGPSFTQLLKYTDDRELANFIIDETGARAYKVDYLSGKINEWAKDREKTREHIKENAVIISALISEFKWKSEQPKVNLLFCTDGYQAKCTTPVFIKEKRLSVTEPPEFVNIKFMDSEMKNELEKYLDAGSIVNQLRFLNVYEYSIDKIIEKMTTSIDERMKAGDIDTAKRFSDQCLDWIWKNREYISGGVRVFLSTREGNLKKSDKLYIGEEYGNSICEDLFRGVCTDIFVENISGKLDGEHEDWEIWDFLEQLCLAKYPRKITSRITDLVGKQDYLSKVLRSIVFPIKLEGETFFRLNDLHGTRYYKGTVTDVEFLSSILEKSSTQAIVSWINSDEALSSILFKRFDSKAEVEIKWGNKQNYRTLPKGQVYPYLRWKFETSAWIERGKTRYEISRCILKPIGEQFAPVVLQPDIDNYIKELEGDKKQLRIIYENTFSQFGICREYSDLPLDLLYSLLCILPEKDKDGVIARQIYRGIANTKRKAFWVSEKGRFLDNGCVWGNHGYQKVSDTYYLDNKGVCKSICDNYNLIELPTRIDPNKIQDWFGISKLVLEGKVVGEPQQHQLNEMFKNDFQKYKIMAYCYRIDSNPSKNEIERFMGISIVLCSQVKAEYNGKEVILGNYDYISEDGKIYYLQVPDSMCNETELHNLDMGKAISCILCDILNNVSLYERFRDLYTYMQVERKKLVLDDKEDETIIERTTKALGMHKSIKEDFIAVIKKLAKVEYNCYSELLEEIDYEHLDSIANAMSIINCFRMAGLDIVQYNSETTTQKISLLPYYEKKVEVLKTQYRELYKKTLFERMKSESIEEKKKLVDKFFDYEKYEIPIEDSVFFDCEQSFLKAMEITLQCEEIDLVKVYEDNKERFAKDVSTAKFLEEFLQIPKNTSLLYYGEFEVLKTLYESYVKEQKEPIAIDKSKNNLCDNMKVFNVKTVPNSLKANIAGKKSMKLGYSKLSVGRENERENIGFKGEAYAYRYLKEEFETVAWVSENARKANVNPEGSAELGYDMEYIDSKGKKMYVEVKASVSDIIEFHMTSSEYNFAKKHSDEYKVLFVAKATSDSPKMYVLSNLMTKDGFNINSYSVQIDEYTVSAKLESQDEV